MAISLGEREDIGFALPGAHIQHFSLGSNPYGVLFVPRGSWVDITADQVTAEIGVHIPQNAYEIKFDTKPGLLSSNSSSAFRTRAQMGLKPFTFKELNLIGSALLASIDLFDTDYHGASYYGRAIDQNPQLCYFYERLYRNYSTYFMSKGLVPYTSDGGTCYAFLR